MANILFTPVKINNMIVANRFVRSATHEGVLDGGGLWNSRLEEILTELADGELGLIISGHAFVSPAGRAGRNQASAASDECIAPWERIVEKLHLLQSRIILQLAHAGGFALDPETAVGSSPFAASPRRPPCRALSIAEIDQLTGQFVDAAIRAREAGFDGVQIHAAHGYLLSQFLSGHYNHRSDAYGGSPENRARLLCEIVSEIRKAVGSSFPVLVKVNSEDFVADGFQAAECVELCRKLEALGVDAIELSGGIPAAPPELGSVRAVNDGPFYVDTACRVRSAVRIPVILVGGFREFFTCMETVTRGICDMIALSRPLIREPELVLRWHTGEMAPAACDRCNGCFRPIVAGRSFGCPRRK